MQKVNFFLSKFKLVNSPIFIFLFIEGICLLGCYLPEDKGARLAYLMLSIIFGLCILVEVNITLSLYRQLFEKVKEKMQDHS